MKKFLLSISLLIGISSYGQTVDSTKIDSIPTVSVDTVKSTNDSLTTVLNSYSKIKLTEIYLNEIVRVTNILPICAFDTLDNNVPKSKYTQGKFRRTENKMVKFNEVLLKEYREIIPYADKKELIRSIIYLKSLK
jgi:hypothetical protein